jgi:hypothetical protein
MNSPIEKLIDAQVRCVKCGEPRGCACWIFLRCPRCGKKKMIDRTTDDYPDAERVEIICPKCDDGDFHETMYYDKAGKHITRDPNMTANA